MLRFKFYFSGTIEKMMKALKKNLEEMQKQSSLSFNTGNRNLIDILLNHIGKFIKIYKKYQLLLF